MNAPAAGNVAAAPRLEGWTVVVLVVATVVGGYQRLAGLGERSLWHDEFATWHVSRLPLGESLTWQPELTKPPLYQLVLRLFLASPHPAEESLRLPAAVCGVLLIPAGFWLARRAGGETAAAAVAILLACHPLQIEYSREARPYSMLALGSTLSLLLWHKLWTRPDWKSGVAYLFVTAATFYANYLMGLTIFAQAAWGAFLWLGRRRKSSAALSSATRSWSPARPWTALVGAGLLCAPLAIHYLRVSQSAFQGLEWIPPASVAQSLQIMAEVSYRTAWVFVALSPALLLWGLAGLTRDGTLPLWRGRRVRLFGGIEDAGWLLGFMLAFVWGGLLLVSWLGQPLLVPRYALAATAPALLLPLLVAQRVYRWAPLVLAALFALDAAPDWLFTPHEPKPGFRELTKFLDEHAAPDGVAVMVISSPAESAWADLDRAALRYYPIRGRVVREFYLQPQDAARNQEALTDPRRLYLIVFFGNPLPPLAAAGRRVELFTLEGERFERLFFDPYRLLQIAPTQ